MRCPAIAALPSWPGSGVSGVVARALLQVVAGHPGHDVSAFTPILPDLGIAAWPSHCRARQRMSWSTGPRVVGTVAGVVVVVAVGSSLLAALRGAWSPASCHRRRPGSTVGASRSGRWRRQLLLELVLELVLRPGGLDAGAPQLVGDEPEHQQPDAISTLPSAADAPAPVVRLGRPVPLRASACAHRPAARSRVGGAPSPGLADWSARQDATGIGRGRLRTDASRRSVPRRHAHGTRWSSCVDVVVAVLGSFPALAGATSTVAAGEIVLLRVPTAPARPPCCGCAPGCCRRACGTRARARARPRRPSATRSAPGSACSATRNGLYARPDRRRERHVLGRDGRRRPTTRSTAAIERLGLDGRLADVPVAQAVGRPAAAHRAGLPASPAAPSCGCSTSPTPASTPPAATSSTPSLRQAVAAGATVIVASHELERAGALATRVGRRRRRPGRRARHGAEASMSPSWRIARLVAGKDLRIERRSRVVINQVLPVRGVTMVLSVRLRPRHATDACSTVAPGLIWLAMLFSLLVLVQRAFAVEADDGALDALRVAGRRPGGIFLGKALALAVQLLGARGGAAASRRVVLYGADDPPAGSCCWSRRLAATCGLACVGTLYGGLAAGFTGRETLLPLLLLPVVAPVLIGATRAVEAALGTDGRRSSEGWPWVGLLAVFAVAFGVGGAGVRSADRGSYVSTDMSSTEPTDVPRHPSRTASTRRAPAPGAPASSASPRRDLGWSAPSGCCFSPADAEQERRGAHPVRPRPDRVGRLPGVHRHRARARRSTCSASSTRSGGTASPARAPRSAWRSWRSRWSPASLWGRLTWGVYWQWDARLTTTALLFVTLHRLPRRARPRRHATSSGPSAARSSACWSCSRSRSCTVA